MFYGKIFRNCEIIFDDNVVKNQGLPENFIKKKTSLKEGSFKFDYIIPIFMAV